MGNDIFLFTYETAAIIRILAFDLSKFAVLLMFSDHFFLSYNTAAVGRELALDPPELALILFMRKPDILLPDELAALPSMLAWSWHGLYCLRNIK